MRAKLKEELLKLKMESKSRDKPKLLLNHKSFEPMMMIQKRVMNMKYGKHSFDACLKRFQKTYPNAVEFARKKGSALTFTTFSMHVLNEEMGGRGVEVLTYRDLGIESDREMAIFIDTGSIFHASIFMDVFDHKFTWGKSLAQMVLEPPRRWKDRLEEAEHGYL